uniref:histidine--tRNA ligase n=1 Tax=Pterothamnion crispum TaxID=1550583 RepID=A0A4D6WX21_9FLOR|nr:Histidine-tRNA ligase [Pterothamnion crispum]
MQPLRGTKDILPEEVILWQHIYNTVHKILTLSNYNEIRTPIIETTNLFQRSIGDDTDIMNKEMYNFIDQSNRNITLRPEGTASIARSFISNKLYSSNTTQRLWYLGPMFRYERPQNGRQRQFHQLGIECIGSSSPMADVEVIRLANKILQAFQCNNYNIEINSIGNLEERNNYKNILIEYIKPYIKDLDQESQKRLYTNPLRILDSKNLQTQEILNEAPKLISVLNSNSIEHFNQVCDLLKYLNIQYTINHKLVRGLDYYNDTAFEIQSNILGSQNTICGGGRYDSLIKQLGGPDTPSVGWAIGLERLVLILQNNLNISKNNPSVYIIHNSIEAKYKIWELIQVLEQNKIKFDLDLSLNTLQKQLKKAYNSGSLACIIIGENELKTASITLRKLSNNAQKTIPITSLIKELKTFLL